MERLEYPRLIPRRNFEGISVGLHTPTRRPLERIRKKREFMRRFPSYLVKFVAKIFDFPT